jgi:hypothetical protein
VEKRTKITKEKTIKWIMNLIISPHSDDEFGAFSFLEGSVVVYVAIDESLVADQDKRYRIGIKKKEKEMMLVAKATGIAETYILEHKTYNLEFNQLIYDLEQIINIVKPDTVLIPTNTGTNPDHKLVYDACLVVLRRHDKNHWVKNVLIYEDLQPVNSLVCDYFKSVDINAKMKAFELYASQMRNYRHPLMFYSIAKVHGHQSNMGFAEGFKIYRMCNDA